MTVPPPSYCLPRLSYLVLTNLHEISTCTSIFKISGYPRDIGRRRGFTPPPSSAAAPSRSCLRQGVSRLLSAKPPPTHPPQVWAPLDLEFHGGHFLPQAVYAGPSPKNLVIILENLQKSYKNSKVLKSLKKHFLNLYNDDQVPCRIRRSRRTWGPCWGPRLTRTSSSSWSP